MTWLRKNRSDANPVRLPYRAHAAFFGQALTGALTLFLALAVATQLFIPGLLTDRVSPVRLVALVFVGMLLGSLGRRESRWGVGSLAATAATMAVAVAAGWEYFAVLPSGRFAYTMLLAVALLLAAWPRRAAAEEKN